MIVCVPVASALCGVSFSVRLAKHEAVASLGASPVALTGTSFKVNIHRARLNGGLLLER